MKKVLLGVVIALILGVGGCFAIVATALSGAEDAVEAEEQNDTPTAVTEGSAFTHDDFAAAQGWQVAQDQMGSVTINGLGVTNEADSARTAMLTFTFVRGNENLAEVECSSNELQPGQKSQLECFSTSSSFPEGYEEIQVADAF